MLVKCRNCGKWNRIKNDLMKGAVCGGCRRSLADIPLIQEIDESGFQVMMRESNQPVLVDFWATWCQPCRMMAPVLEKFASRHPGVQVVKIDTDRAPSLATRFRIETVPSFLIFDGGSEQKRVSGVFSIGDLENHFRTWLGAGN